MAPVSTLQGGTVAAKTKSRKPALRSSKRKGSKSSTTANKKRRSARAKPAPKKKPERAKVAPKKKASRAKAGPRKTVRAKTAPEKPDRLVPLIAAADQGDASAAHTLYEVYLNGNGVKADLDLARQYLERAAKAGLPEAQVEMGSDWCEDDAEALEWATKAADQGSAAGHFLVASLLRRGGGPADAEQAERHLLAAAAGGHERAVEEVKTMERRRLLAVDGLERVLRDLAASHGLVARADAILALRLPSIRAVATPGASGTSRLGGRPDLPADVEWPTYHEHPLSFVAQIALEEVAPFDTAHALPESGLLSFFYDIREMFEEPEHDPAKVKALYTPTGTALQPHDVPDGAEAFKSCPLTFFAETTIPFARTRAARSLDLSNDEFRRYSDLFGDWWTSQRKPVSDGEVHRLLGHPDAIQGDMTRRLVYGLREKDLSETIPELEEEAGHWRLLLQIDSDRAAGMMWGDLGRLFFWIRDDALAATRFDQVYAQMQCS
jgi:hypothetical protein